MASGLRAKLRAIGSAGVQPPRAERAGGVICRVQRFDADPRLRALSPVGLRRIGWSGRAFDPEKCLFLDTETTGLSGGAGTVAFLVGVGFVKGGCLTIEQYLMRDYADEPELLDRLANRMDGFDCVCTFNGRTFDMPLLEARFTMARMRHRWRALENLDLLPPARRTWKLRLGSCRLARVEELALGMPRGGDLPGSEAPERFFEFLRTGDLSLLDAVVEHNRQDIASLATLLVRLCEIYAEPEKLSERRDQYSVGRALERQGELRPARELYRASGRPRAGGHAGRAPGRARRRHGELARLPDRAPLERRRRNARRARADARAGPVALRGARGAGQALRAPAARLRARARPRAKGAGALRARGRRGARPARRAAGIEAREGGRPAAGGRAALGTAFFSARTRDHNLGG